MDRGRLSDLARLQKIIDDPTKSKGIRKWADKTKKTIVRQLKDRRLRRLREQLIRAAWYEDAYVEWKIANTIKDYEKKEKFEVYSEDSNTRR